jgi:hypothetical protein
MSALRSPAAGSSRPPRVVYHLNSIAFGGMELHALTLACGVARAGALVIGTVARLEEQKG